MILAVDPGDKCSGWVMYEDGRLIDSGVWSNADLLSHIEDSDTFERGTDLAIEAIASYGMPVGKEVFDTCIWIGRFMQAWPRPDEVVLVYRSKVKLHLCHSSRAKDGNVRQALLDRFERSGGGVTPQVGIKAKPGPLYGISTHAWAALGVAVTVEAGAH